MIVSYMMVANRVGSDTELPVKPRLALSTDPKLTAQYHGRAPRHDIFGTVEAPYLRTSLGDESSQTRLQKVLTQQKAHLFDTQMLILKRAAAAVVLGAALVSLSAWASPLMVVGMTSALAPIVGFLLFHAERMYIDAYRQVQAAKAAILLNESYLTLLWEPHQIAEDEAKKVLLEANRMGRVQGLSDARLDPLLITYANLMNEAFN